MKTIADLKPLPGCAYCGVPLSWTIWKKGRSQFFSYFCHNRFCGLTDSANHKTEESAILRAKSMDARAKARAWEREDKCKPSLRTYWMCIARGCDGCTICKPLKISTVKTFKKKK